MNRTNYRVSLNIKEIYSPFTISMKRGDTSGRLLITLMSGGKPFQIPEGCYATFETTRPDNVIIHEGCIVQNNTIIFDIGKNVTAVSGKLPCEITLYDLDGTVLVSPQFAIMVYETVFSQETVESSNEYSSLTTLISGANSLINEVETKLKNGEFIGEKGIQGDQGERGEKGEKGDDGVSTTHSWNGTVLTIKSASGTSSADLKGEKGDDGVSATHTWNGTVLTIKSASGTSSADLKGEKGDPGVDGETHPVEFVTQAKYNELKESGGLVKNCVYYITDDPTMDEINAQLEYINEKLKGIDNGEKVPKAEHANEATVLKPTALQPNTQGNIPITESGVYIVCMQERNLTDYTIKFLTDMILVANLNSSSLSVKGSGTGGGVAVTYDKSFKCLTVGGSNTYNEYTIILAYRLC